jgi:hypothetical protein
VRAKVVDPGAMGKAYGLLLLFVGLSVQQKDPLNDFCRRFAHQAAVIDSKLYIDGGFVDWNPISQNPQNYTSELARNQGEGLRDF